MISACDGCSVCVSQALEVVGMTVFPWVWEASVMSCGEKIFVIQKVFPLKMPVTNRLFSRPSKVELRFKKSSRYPERGGPPFDSTWPHP